MTISSSQQNIREYYDHKAQQESINKMAITPGRHSDNILRQDLSNVFLHFLARTTCAQQSHCNSLTTNNTVNPPSIIYPSPHDPICVSQHAPAQATSWKNTSQSDIIKKRKINYDICPDLNRLDREVCQAFDKLTRLQAAEQTLSNPPAKNLSPSTPFTTTVKMAGAKITSLLSHIAGVLNKVGDLINLYDPLSPPLAEAFPVSENKYVGKSGDERSIIEGIEDKILNLKNNSDDVAKKKENDNFIQAGRAALISYFEKYSNKYPDLKDIAATVLQERISQQFHLKIDPNKSYFITFMERFDNGVNITYFKPLTKKTLTECLFTNFDSDFWKYYVRVDAVSAIYDISYLDNHITDYDFKDRIKIDASKFGDLVWKIDFYNYAKQKLIERYNNKDAHIKNIFISFINHLDSSQIDHDSATDVLNGVGLLKDINVTAAFFDINGYSAANAFIFKNSHSGRITLYFPKSDFKFFSFRGDFEMRSWVANTCATEKHRAMIASHFTIANRKNNLFYDGIDAWLNTINKDNSYSDRVAIKAVGVSSDNFFTDFFNSVKNKALSDLWSQIKSDARVERDIYEEMIEASNFIPNPVSPFLTLAIHIEHALDAVTYDEQMQAWSKIKNDAVSLIIMVVLDRAMALPDTEGDAFFDSVKENLDTSALKSIP
ncbi:hypothetical protein SM114_13100 [Erwinia pyrifoliae]|uniref:dermonecrotic toxin domain-containing protein n=1 Tax=Erwinia pyrifoliae TaxID=79967 RepID=UPI0034D984B7